MQLTILQENLISGLLKVSKFVDSKGQLPILANILFNTEKGKLKLSATNLETGLNIKIPAKVEKQGKITIPAKNIVEFISSLPADKVCLNLNQEKLQVSCRNYKAIFNGISAAEFPDVSGLEAIKKDKKPEKIKMDMHKFLKAASQITYTAAIDENRPVLTGVKIEFLNNKIRFIATDGYRLSIKEISLKINSKINGFIIPAKTLTEMVKLFSADEYRDEEKIDVVIVDSGKQVIVSCKDLEIISRLIEGDFPDFGKIIPVEKNTSLTIRREDLLYAVKAASIFARDSANIIKLKIKDQKLNISANAPEVGENEVELRIEKKGDDNDIAFNFRFLLEFLANLDVEEIALEILGPLKPGVFKLLKDKSLLHIIMPVRVQE